MELRNNEDAGYYKYPIDDWNEYMKLAKAKFDSQISKVPIADSRGLTNYIRVSVIGAGAYGRVSLVRYDHTDQFYALKIMEKDRIISLGKVEMVMNEKKILFSLRCPFSVHVTLFFKDYTYLYLLMPYIQGGEMFTMLRSVKFFREDLVRFYAAQVILALEYLHYFGLIYRDIKPENILIGLDGYIKITDFGFAKRIKGRTYTLCGTPEYMAPEILRNHGYGFSADWWSLGVLIYELASGYSPFQADSVADTFECVLRGRYRMIHSFSSSLKDLIANILVGDPTRRYGCMFHGVDDIKSHSFLKVTPWMGILNKRAKAPYIPVNRGYGDTSHFLKIEDEPLIYSDRDKYPKIFEDF